MVAKYWLRQSFCHAGIFDLSVSSLAKSSWKDILPILATESSDVRASADTHMVMKTLATVFGTPKVSRKPATPCEKIWNGVRSAGTAPFTATAPQTRSAQTPRSVSTTIAPYPTKSISFSFFTVFEDVPEDTRLWKPETAPHAMVTKSVGKMKLFEPFAAVSTNPLKALSFISG